MVDRKTGNGRKSTWITVNIIGAAVPGNTRGPQFGRAEPSTLCESITTSQSPGKRFCPAREDWRHVPPWTFLQKLVGGVLHLDQGVSWDPGHEIPPRQALERGWNLQEREGQDQSRPVRQGPPGAGWRADPWAGPTTAVHV